MSTNVPDDMETTGAIISPHKNVKLFDKLKFAYFMPFV